MLQALFGLSSSCITHNLSHTFQNPLILFEIRLCTKNPKPYGGSGTFKTDNSTMFVDLIVANFDFRFLETD